VGARKYTPSARSLSSRRDIISFLFRPVTSSQCDEFDETHVALGTPGEGRWANVVTSIVPWGHTHRPRISPAVCTESLARQALCFPGVYANHFSHPSCVPIIVVLFEIFLVLWRYLLTASRSTLSSFHSASSQSPWSLWVLDWGVLMRCHASLLFFVT
jgi:hypothetical protein